MIMYPRYLFHASQTKKKNKPAKNKVTMLYFP